MPRRNSFKSLSNVTRAERVRMQLSAEIIAGLFAPGTRLDEVAQSNRMGVSRTPLREAIRQLATLGLVENRPHRGVVVCEGGGAALFEALVELEAVCVRLAIDRMGPRGLGELARIAQEGGDWLAMVHHGCANGVLVGLLETLWQPLRAAGLSSSQGLATRSGQEIANAIGQKDRHRAEIAIRDYVHAATSAFTVPAWPDQGVNAGTLA